MSLLTGVTRGADTQVYFVENIGGAGLTAADAPCLKGTTLGTVRIGDPADGLLIRGDTIANANRIGGGQLNGGSLTIGNSTTSFQNIVLTDAGTAINTDLTLGFPGTPGSGDLILSNGATGSSISGYYSSSVALGGSGPIANPAGLTAGMYAVFVSPTNPADRLASPSSVFYWSGTAWIYGNAVSSAHAAGVPNCVISPAAGLATLEVTGTGVPAGTVVFSKLMN